MSDLLSSFTVYRDVLLLLINAGMLVLLFVIAGQMNGQRQRSKVIPKHITELLEQILTAQRKAATSLTATNNEFRNQLKEIVLSVESSVQRIGESSGEPDTEFFRAPRRGGEKLDAGVTQALDRLQAIAKEGNDSLDRLIAAIDRDTAEDRKLTEQFRKTLRADLKQQSDRVEKALTQLPSRMPVQAAGDGGKNVTVAAPNIDLNPPLNKWFTRAQELHNSLVAELRNIGKRFEVPTGDVAQASDQNFAQLRTMFENFMIENARHGKEAEDFQRSLRKDFQAQANLLGKVVAEIPNSLAGSRASSPVAAAPAQANVSVINDSLKQWLERTQSMHESMLNKMQSSGGGNGNGNGHDAESGLAAQEFKQALGQHHESLRKVLKDFMTENVRQTQSAEAFRSELREDIRNQTSVLTRVVSEMSKQAKPVSDSDACSAAPTPVELNLEGPLNEWLGKTEQLHRSLIDELRESRQQIQFPTNEFRQITDQHHNSLRRLLEDWTDESIRRVRATDELRAAIQQDIKVQVDRLKKLSENPAPTPAATQTAGTITASATAEESREWREDVRAELGIVIGKLDRMQERLEEIFQV